MKSLLQRTENAYLTLGLLFGVVFCFAMAPFHVPDEPNHFYRSWQVAGGRMLAEREGERVGGEMPVALARMADGLHGRFIENAEAESSVGALADFLNMPLEASQTTFQSFPNTALYTPLPYLPQATAMAAFRAMRLPPLAAFYAGRLAAALTATLLLYLAVRLMPVQRRAFALLALMPMTMQQVASVSVDSLTIALTFLLTAWGLNLALIERERIDRRRLALFFLLAVLVCGVKQSYFPLFALFLAIPPARVGGTKKFVALAAALTALCLGFVFLWSWLVRDLHANPRLDLPASAIDSASQMEFILSHPLRYLGIVVEDYIVRAPRYARQFVGWLGWLDTPLPVWLQVFYGTAILGFAIFDAPDERPLGRARGIGVALLAAAMLLLISTSAFVLWTPAGKMKIDWLQGRYFIPVAPLLLPLFRNRRWHIRLGETQRNAAAMAVAAFTLTATTVILLRRYWL